MDDKQKTLMDNCVKNLALCAQLIQEYNPEETKADTLKQVKKLAKAYYDLDIKNQKVNAALALTQQHFAEAADDTTDDVNEIFKQKLSDIVVPQVSFEEHSIMKKLTKSIADGVKGENGDDSVVCSQASQRPIDPITKAAINVPFKSKTCGHVFDKASIFEYIKSRKGKPVRCPYIGCTNVNVKQDELFLDEKLAQQIKANIWNDSSVLNDTSLISNNSVLNVSVG